MNLLTMLELANKPWTKPEPAKRKKSAPSDECNRMANEAKRNIALNKYRKAFGLDHWVQTTVLADRLKMDRGCISETLRKWEKLGFVEHRNFNNEPYHYKKGFEWRFLK